MIDKNNIPKHWEIKKLDEVAKWGSGGTPSSTNSSYYGGNIPWLIIGDLNDNVVVSSEKKITDLGLKNSSTKIVKADSVLIAMYGSIGKLGINKIPVATNQAIAFTSELYQNIFNKYLFYFLLHKRSYLHSLGKGGTQKNISQTVLKKIQIPLPSLSEQRAIVAKIEELLSELENGKQQLLTAQQQLKVYRQSLLKWLYDKSVGSVPVKLIDVCDFITKGTTPSKDKLFSTKGDVPFLKVYNLTFNGTLDFSKEPTFVDNKTHNVFLKRSIVYPDDVLMNIVGPPLGKVSIVPDTYPEWNINQAMVRFRCKEKLFNKYLLYFLLCENTIRTYSRKAKATAGQFNLTLEICRDIEIPLPSIKEQKIIVDELESKLTICDKIEETISQILQQLETLRRSILKKAFEGRLVGEEIKINNKKNEQ